MQIGYTDFSMIKEKLYHAMCKTYYTVLGQGRIYNSDVFSSIGVRVILKQLNYSEQEFPYYSLVLIINPRLLVGDQSYLGIYESTPLTNHLLIAKLNNCICRLGLTEYRNVRLGRTLRCTIEDFSISRLDLCTNYKFESDDIAASYLKLMRRGNRCRFLQEDTHYDHSAHRCRPYSDALLLRAASFDISIYNKYRQMKDNLCYFKEIPEEANGLLRFEMQLHPAKLRYLLQKVPDISLADLLSYTQDLCRAEFERYTKMLFCTGDYYTLNLACKIIQAHKTAVQSDKMIHFLQDVSANRSLYQTIRDYQRDGRSARYLLDGLARLGVNPVTIPEKWFGKAARLSSIPSLLGFCVPNNALPSQELHVC